MESPFKIAIGNLQRSRDMAALAQTISAKVTQAIDTSDYLRCSIVMSVSALDHYVHEATRIGMLDIAQGRRVPTDAYSAFKVSMSAFSAARECSDFSWLDQEIRSRHGWQTFQHPDKISEAIRLFSPIDIWVHVGCALGMSVKDVKSQLRLILERRNKIAHEADMDPSFPDSRWPISYSQVDDTISFLEKVIRSIDCATSGGRKPYP